jgi:hypothetical protein
LPRTIKTVQTDQSVVAFLATIADPVLRADSETLTALMQTASGEPAAMWGSSIIGCGRYEYRYDSGHSGTMAKISFAPRKSGIVLYLYGAEAEREALLQPLGKLKLGKGCIYLPALQKLDQVALETLLRQSYRG